VIATPTLFVSHGAPTLALHPGKTGAALQRLAQSLPRPRALLLISAHWNTQTPTVSAARTPETIYDFHGFPPALYQLTYPAPGAPALAQRVHQLLDAAAIPTQIDPQRGLDHGAWVPLRMLYPQADVPVTQLSVQPRENAAHHYRLGQALKPLRDDGVLVIGSGSFTHNLYEIGDFGDDDAPTQPYVAEFCAWMRQRLHAHDIEALTAYRDQAPHAARAHPTTEHLLPLFVALGAADGEDRVTHVDPGTTFGVLAMDAFAFGGEL